MQRNNDFHFESEVDRTDRSRSSSLRRANTTLKNSSFSPKNATHSKFKDLNITNRIQEMAFTNASNSRAQKDPLQNQPSMPLSQRFRKLSIDGSPTNNNNPIQPQMQQQQQQLPKADSPRANLKKVKKPKMPTEMTAAHMKRNLELKSEFYVNERASLWEDTAHLNKREYETMIADLRHQNLEKQQQYQKVLDQLIHAEQTVPHKLDDFATVAAASSSHFQSQSQFSLQAPQSVLQGVVQDTQENAEHLLFRIEQIKESTSEVFLVTDNEKEKVQQHLAMVENIKKAVKKAKQGIIDLTELGTTYDLKMAAMHTRFNSIEMSSQHLENQREEVQKVLQQEENTNLEKIAAFKESAEFHASSIQSQLKEYNDFEDQKNSLQRKLDATIANIAMLESKFQLTQAKMQNQYSIIEDMNAFTILVSTFLTPNPNPEEFQEALQLLTHQNAFSEQIKSTKQEREVAEFFREHLTRFEDIHERRYEEIADDLIGIFKIFESQNSTTTMRAEDLLQQKDNLVKFLHSKTDEFSSKEVRSLFKQIEEQRQELHHLRSVQSLRKRQGAVLSLQSEHKDVQDSDSLLAKTFLFLGSSLFRMTRILKSVRLLIFNSLQLRRPVKKFATVVVSAAHPFDRKHTENPFSTENHNHAESTAFFIPGANRKESNRLAAINETSRFTDQDSDTTYIPQVQPRSPYLNLNNSLFEAVESISEEQQNKKSSIFDAFKSITTGQVNQQQIDNQHMSLRGALVESEPEETRIETDSEKDRYDKSISFKTFLDVFCEHLNNDLLVSHFCSIDSIRKCFRSLLSKLRQTIDSKNISLDSKQQAQESIRSIGGQLVRENLSELRTQGQKEFKQEVHSMMENLIQLIGKSKKIVNSAPATTSSKKNPSSKEIITNANKSKTQSTSPDWKKNLVISRIAEMQGQYHLETVQSNVDPDILQINHSHTDLTTEGETKVFEEISVRVRTEDLVEAEEVDFITTQRKEAKSDGMMNQNSAVAKASAPDKSNRKSQANYLEINRRDALMRAEKIQLIESMRKFTSTQTFEKKSNNQLPLLSAIQLRNGFQTQRATLKNLAPVITTQKNSTHRTLLKPDIKEKSERARSFFGSTQQDVEKAERIQTHRKGTSQHSGAWTSRDSKPQQQQQQQQQQPPSTRVKNNSQESKRILPLQHPKPNPSSEISQQQKNAPQRSKLQGSLSSLNSSNNILNRVIRDHSQRSLHEMKSQNSTRSQSFADLRMRKTSNEPFHSSSNQFYSTHASMLSCYSPNPILGISNPNSRVPSSHLSTLQYFNSDQQSLVPTPDIQEIIQRYLL